MSLFSPSLAQLTLNLVEQASVTKQEEELCIRCLDWAQAAFPQALLERKRNGFWLAPRPMLNRPTLALVGHLDTVPQATQQRYLIDDQRVYGLGACDMKGGVALMMHLLGLESTWCNLVGVFYDREEGPYADNGLDLLLPSLPQTDLAIVLEPTSNRIQAGCVGSMHCRLSFRGRRAHSARPWQGDNAIYKLGPALSRLAARERREVVIAGLPFFEVMSATQLVCDNPANAIPELVSLNLNYRFAPGKSQERAWAEVLDEFGHLAEIELREFAPAGEVSLDQPQLQAWIGRNRLTVEAKQAWTDVARLTRAGIPAVNFGPGDPAQAHQADEFVTITALEEGLALLKDLVQ
jgi:succinyl-diaminopimelate desuccinylase